MRVTAIAGFTVYTYMYRHVGTNIQCTLFLNRYTDNTCTLYPQVLLHIVDQNTHT